MANFRFANAARYAVLYSTTLAFTLATVTPVYAFEAPQYDANIADINLAIKFEKLIEKANKYFKAKDSKKLLEVMLDMKHETDLQAFVFMLVITQAYAVLRTASTWAIHMSGLCPSVKI